VVRHYLILVLQITVVVLVAWLLSASFGIRSVCNGESMESTIPEGATVWLNRLSYRIWEPKAGDIIAFKPAGNTTASASVKRIVAVPGDRVLIKNGKLYVNDALVELKQSDTSVEEAGRAATELTLGDNEYFVLGDNVNNSEDSRYESIGNVKKDDILGRVWFVLSFPGFGLVE
jgi:signal peptidase I